MISSASLLAAALVTPAALALGLSAALVSFIAVGIALAAFVLSDYHRVGVCDYAKTTVRRTEAHPLAA
ncbi:hypothetical protein [Synoicihabitans lomoniglobus]|uniref:Uncharacterized protein n=1 Tax=Synoicihabitans lomoniglobus TaxID=2909285 RepID=A0AAE9ZRP1_9BACT|nr:hypothetical protein [Opitutaceae bacterium LMO-M01]WED64005.1 hypothetical protein PXH66_16830 [Opitutaceae bacterium LMO-M01]